MTIVERTTDVREDEGEGERTRSSVELDNTFTMRIPEGSGTVVKWGADAKIGGLMASVGRGSSTRPPKIRGRDHRSLKRSYLLPRRSGVHQRLQVARRCGHSFYDNVEAGEGILDGFIIVGVARLPPPLLSLHASTLSPSASPSCPNDPRSISSGDEVVAR